MIKLGNKWEAYVFDNAGLKLTKEDESKYFYNADENGSSKIIAYIISVNEETNEVLIATSSDWISDLILIG